MIHRIFNGRAKRLWNRNVRLYRRGLPVPEPITYIESSLKKKNAYFVSSVIPDSKSLYFLHREGVLQGNKVLVKKLAAAISQWHLSGAIHGDLKWPNILVRAENGVYECFFIDLDQAKICSRPNISGICGDIERFYRFGLQIGAEYWVETEFLPEYLSFMPAALRTEIDLTRIKNKSIKEWTKRGREKL
ncbi:MAG TPA: lipopolysaccharide kinase InaA family protein [Thermodesulfovibrionales bacterium]|nr:lipopolysaccharide kinase InaA family protein [Thermodesulfovibrionales bacterium]